MKVSPSTECELTNYNERISPTDARHSKDKPGTIVNSEGTFLALGRVRAQIHEENKLANLGRICPQPGGGI